MDVHARISGDITLALPPTAKFDLTASTGMGEVDNSFGGSITIDESRRGGTLRGSNGGPVLSLRTERGRMTVRTAEPDEPPLEPRYGSKTGKILPVLPPKTIDQ